MRPLTYYYVDVVLSSLLRVSLSQVVHRICKKNLQSCSFFIFASKAREA